MKSILTIISILFIFNIENNQDDEQDSLSFINNVNKLEFTFVNNKCGEWGGDEKNIIIYREDFKGELLADYTEKIKTCNSAQESKISTSKNKIKLTQSNNQLIIEMINEVTRNKLNREDYPSHSGLFCEVLLSDSTIFIKDFPAKEWKSFNRFSDIIKKR